MNSRDFRKAAWMRGRLRTVVSAAVVVGFVGCTDGVTPPDSDVLFQTVVTMGNSITAGYQSGGINDSTQMQSWAVKLAAATGTDAFVVPLLAGTGCIPPYSNIFTGERTAPVNCSGRANAGATIHNVAVPGASLADILSNTDPASNPNALTTVLLEGKTQMEAAQAVSPSFVAAWIGSNDALGAALVGDPALLTSQANFSSRYSAIVTALEALNLQGALLVGVPDVANIPHLSPGTMYWVFSQLGAFPPTFTVHGSCASAKLGGLGDDTLVPFGYAFGVLLAAAIGGTPVTLNCATDAAVLTGSEIITIRTAIGDFNQVIADAAGDHGWAYLDPNVGLSRSRNAGQLPQFPNATGIDALLRPFGDVFSLDGFHPSATGNLMIAQEAVRAINRYYGTSLVAPTQ